MNLKQLSTFREVMITGSVSAAARNLNRSQPSVSAMIAALESELGIKLFERVSGRLKPVSEAHFLLSETDQILARVQSTRQTLSNIRDFRTGNIRIASMPGPALFVLPHLIGDFVDGRDDIQISLISKSSVNVQRLLEAQQFDLGLADMTLGTPLASHLVTFEEFHFDCLCAMRSDDPLAAKATITPDDLDGKPMGALFAEHITCRQTKSAFEVAGAVFNQRFEMQYFVPMFSLIESRLMYSIVDPISAESYRLGRLGGQTLAFRPFRPVVTYASAILTPLHRPLSLASRAFAERLRQRLISIREATPTAGRSRS